MAFARWWYAMQGDKKASEASSKSGQKKAETTEKSSTSANVTQPPKAQTSGAPSTVKLVACAFVWWKKEVLPLYSFLLYLCGFAVLCVILKLFTLCSGTNYSKPFFWF